MRGIRRRAQSLLGMTDREEVQRELDFHLAERMRELVDAGMAEDAARAQAEAELGSLDEVSAACLEVVDGQRRAAWRQGMIDGVRQEARNGLRLLRHRRWAAAAVMAVTSLAIAATVATSSLVWSTLFRPLDLPSPDRVVAIHTIDGRVGTPSLRGSSAPGDVADWRRLEAFEALAALNTGRVTILLDDEPQRLEVVLASQGIGAVLGVRMHLGRMLEDADHRQGSAPVVMITHEYWRRALGADSSVIGRVLRFSAGTAEVVGVLPPLPRLSPSIAGDLWFPFDLSENPSRSGTWLRVVARLKPGVEAPLAQAQLDGLMARIGREEARTNALRTAWVEPLDASLTYASRPVLAFIAIAMAFVVLIAGANIAALLLALASDRHGEIAVRSALGAGPGRLRRQFLSESALCSGIGAALGLALAPLAVRGFLSTYPGGLPRGDEVAVTGAVWLCGAALALVLTVLAALPLFRMVRTPAIHTSSLMGYRVVSDRRSERFRTLVVGAQVALCTLLLIAGTLLVRAYGRLTNTPAGFDAAGLVAFNISPPSVRYPAQTDYLAFYDDLLARVRGLPGVKAASYTTLLPYDHDNWTEGMFVEGTQESARETFILYQRVEPDYRQVLGLPLVAGRDLTTEDREGTPRVGLVNETLVRQLFGIADPIGRRIGSGDRWIEIVGVVGAKRHRDLSQEPMPELFVPRRQEAVGRAMWVVVRTAERGAVMLPRLRDVLRRTDSTIAFASATILTERIARSIAPQRFRSLLFGSLAAIALVLAVVGVWSLASYRVSRQMRDIGIRMALGLGPRQARTRVLVDAVIVAGCGVLTGTATALLAAPIVAARGFGVPGIDAATLVAVALFLVGLTATAALRPAVRASRVDPLNAMRSP